MTGSHPRCCSVADRPEDSRDCWPAMCECSCLKTVSNEQCPIFSEMGILLKQPDFKRKLRACLLSATTTEKSHMMQPIYRTHESGEGGFNYAAVSMTTSSIKWPSIRALWSSPAWSCSPLEQLLQDKSPAVPQCILHNSAITGKKKQTNLMTVLRRRGAGGAWFYFHCNCFLLPWWQIHLGVFGQDKERHFSLHESLGVLVYALLSGRGQRDPHLLLIFASWDKHDFGLGEYIINMRSFPLA